MKATKFRTSKFQLKINASLAFDLSWREILLVKVCFQRIRFRKILTKLKKLFFTEVFASNENSIRAPSQNCKMPRLGWKKESCGTVTCVVNYMSCMWFCFFNIKVSFDMSWRWSERNKKRSFDLFSPSIKRVFPFRKMSQPFYVLAKGFWSRKWIWLWKIEEREKLFEFLSLYEWIMSCFIFLSFMSLCMQRVVVWV